LLDVLIQQAAILLEKASCYNDLTPTKIFLNKPLDLVSPLACHSSVSVIAGICKPSVRNLATVSLVPLRSRTVPENILRFISASSQGHFIKISYILIIDS
jgi:hypothetical protein